MENKDQDKSAKPKGKRGVRKTKDPNECTRIESCIYGGRSGNLSLCDYLEVTGKKRPCPVEGCTVYEKKKRGKCKTMVPLEKMGCEGEKVWIN